MFQAEFYELLESHEKVIESLNSEIGLKQNSLVSVKLEKFMNDVIEEQLF